MFTPPGLLDSRICLLLQVYWIQEYVYSRFIGFKNMFTTGLWDSWSKHILESYKPGVNTLLNPINGNVTTSICNILYTELPSY